METRPEKSSRPSSEHRARHFARVREARPADLEAMVELLGHLFKQESDFVPAPAKQRRALSLILAQPSAGRLFVLTLGGKVLGMVSLLFTISTAEGGKAAWLEDLVVAPDQRGRGYGTRLLRAAVDWARREGIARITLLTDSNNSGARGLYLRHGFAASAMQPLRLHLTRRPGVRPALFTMA
jgi:GNAT superfamily N-acetyltransferase